MTQHHGAFSSNAIVSTSFLDAQQLHGCIRLFAGGTGGRDVLRCSKVF